MNVKRIFSILLTVIFLIVISGVIQVILLSDNFWTYRDVIIIFLTAFSAAFAASFFVIIADRLKDRKKRLAKHYDAVVRFQHYLNRIQSKINNNILSLENMMNALRNESILTFVIYDIPTAFDLITDLVNIDFINDLFVLNREIEDVNVDFSTIDRAYNEIKTLTIFGKMGLPEFLSTNEHTIVEFQKVIDHLRKLRDEALGLYTISRILGEESKSYSFIFGFDIKKKYPNDIKKKIEFELTKLENEFKVSGKRWETRYGNDEVYNSEIVMRKLKKALFELIEKDSFLLENKLNERTITHRLAIYIENEFPYWNVDCEYNRNHEDVKRLNLEIENVMTDDIEGKTVFPDIIVHKRDSDNNLIAIEVKKSNSYEAKDHDINKLSVYKLELSYKYAFFIEIKIGNQIKEDETFNIEEV